jgi:hypothetical protein
MINSYQELEKEGERLHQEYLTDLEKANQNQIDQANRAVELHMSEYGCSFAKLLHEIVNS